MDRFASQPGTIQVGNDEMNEYFEHEGKIFKKSSFSRIITRTCVGVSVSGTRVLVINSNKRDMIVEFTKEEWGAFIKGVKSGEFDLD